MSAALKAVYRFSIHLSLVIITNTLSFQFLFVACKIEARVGSTQQQRTCAKYMCLGRYTYEKIRKALRGFEISGRGSPGRNRIDRPWPWQRAPSAWVRGEPPALHHRRPPRKIEYLYYLAFHLDCIFIFVIIETLLELSRIELQDQ